VLLVGSGGFIAQRPTSSTNSSTNANAVQIETTQQYLRQKEKVPKSTGDVQKMEILITIAILFIGAIIGIGVLLAMLHFYAD
jgi:archaellin